MKKYYYVILVFFFACNSFAQNEKDSTEVKSNPIIFIDGLLGGAGGPTNGLVASTSINYQFQKNLVKFKTTYVSEVEKLNLIPFDIRVSEVINEYGLMYGRRFVNYDESWSFVIGASMVHHKKYIDNEVVSRSNSFGVPFELNYRVFKGEKERLSFLYGLVKVGKETSFGRNIGFQLFGNVGKTFYLGFGITYGLGWHKKY